MTAIRASFGAFMAKPDGALDRVAMRQLVFADATARQRLEAILHPLIRVEAERQLRAMAAGTDSAYAVLVVPLLLESADYRQRVQRIVVVDCDEEMQIRRVMARGGLARAAVERILAAQTTRAARRAAADDLIDNSGSLDDLRLRVAGLDEHYRVLAARVGGTAKSRR